MDSSMTLCLPGQKAGQNIMDAPIRHMECMPLEREKSKNYLSSYAEILMLT